MKRLFLMLLLLAGLLCGCGEKGPETVVTQLGEENSTAFFDFVVDSAVSCLGHEGRLAASDCQLILVELTVKNTSSYELPMGRYDFRLMWENDQESAVYPLEQFCEDQFPDEYALAMWEGRQALLIFQVPDDKKDLALGYLEIFENDSQGDAFFVHFTV